MMPSEKESSNFRADRNLSKTCSQHRVAIRNRSKYSKMPCQINCDLRAILLAKEEKISKLQEVKRWVDSLYQQDPNQQELTVEKKKVITKMTIQTLAEAGVLVHRLARGCDICKSLRN